MEKLRAEYLGNYRYWDCAAIAFARDLMRVDINTGRAPYTQENAIIAAQEVFPEAVDVDFDRELASMT